MVILNGYSLKKYKDMEGSDGLAFSGFLMFNKKPVCHFFNGGYGGITEFSVIDKTLWDNAVKMIKDIHKKYNIDNLERTEDSLVESLVIRLIDFNGTWKFIKRETKASKRDKACVDLLLFEEKLGESLKCRFFAFLYKTKGEVITSDYFGEKVKILKEINAYEFDIKQRDIEVSIN